MVLCQRRVAGEEAIRDVVGGARHGRGEQHATQRERAGRSALGDRQVAGSLLHAGTAAAAEHAVTVHWRHSGVSGLMGVSKSRKFK